jgi:hypothetical protein
VRIWSIFSAEVLFQSASIKMSSAPENTAAPSTSSAESEPQAVLLAKIAAHLERQTVEQSRQSKKPDDLHAEIHHRDTSRGSDKIENPGIKKHVEVLEQASSSFAHVKDLLTAHATSASPLFVDQAAIFAEKCDQGKILCKDRIQYHEECDRVGFDVAKELLALRERGKRDPLELALEEKANDQGNQQAPNC